MTTLPLPLDAYARAKVLGSSTLYEASHLSCAVDSAIRPIWDGAFISAPAYPLECSPGDNLALHLAMERVPRGSVLVVGTGSFVPPYQSPDADGRSPDITPNWMVGGTGIEVEVDTETGQFIALLDHIRIRNILLADADFDGHGEVVHQRHQLFQQVFAERRRVGDGDAVGARQLHLGISPGGLRNFAMAEVGQAQFGIAKQRSLLSIRLDPVLEVTLERLAQRRGGPLMQSSKPIHGLLGGLNDNKSFGHGKHPVF